MDKEKEYHYDFVVSGLEQVAAEWLMDIIVRAVSSNGGYLGGGFRDVEDEAATEDE